MNWAYNRIESPHWDKSNTYYVYEKVSDKSLYRILSGYLLYVRTTDFRPTYLYGTGVEEDINYYYVIHLPRGI